MSFRMAGPVCVEELEGRRLLSVADAAAWDLKTPISAELSQKGEVDYYRFEAQGGQKFVFNSLGDKTFNILDSDGKTKLDHVFIFDGAISNGPTPGRLEWEAPHSGSFYVSVEGYLAFLIDVPTGSYSLAAFKVNDSQKPADGGLIAAGQTISGSLSGAGDIDYYSFDAKAGTIYRFQLTSDHLPNSGDTAHFAFGVVEALPWRPMPPEPEDAQEAYPGHNIYYVNLDFQKALGVTAEWVAPASGQYHFSIAPLDAEHAGAYTLTMSQRAFPCDPQAGTEATSQNTQSKSSSHSLRHRKPKLHHRKPNHPRHHRKNTAVLDEPASSRPPLARRGALDVLRRTS